MLGDRRLRLLTVGLYKMNKLVGLVDLYAPRSSPGVAREKRRARQLTVTRSLPALPASEHAEQPLAGDAVPLPLIESARVAAMNRAVHGQLKLAHEQLAAERLEAAVAKRAAQQATAAAERMREDAQQLADAHRKAADRRLARHMSAQRVALQKEMRQLQVDQAATMETAAKARRSHIERIRELEAELTQAKAERTNQEVPLEPQTAQTRGLGRAVILQRPPVGLASSRPRGSTQAGQRRSSGTREASTRSARS